MILDILPKVSCTLVVTEPDLVKESVFQYLNQSYPYKELVIVSTQNLEPFDLSEVQFVKAPQDLTVCQLWDLSVELSLGDLICPWSASVYPPGYLRCKVYSVKSDPSVVAVLDEKHDLALFRKEFFHRSKNRLHSHPDGVLKNLQKYGKVMQSLRGQW